MPVIQWTVSCQFGRQCGILCDDSILRPLGRSSIDKRRASRGRNRPEHLAVGASFLPQQSRRVRLSVCPSGFGRSRYQARAAHQTGHRRQAGRRGSAASTCHGMDHGRRLSPSLSSARFAWVRRAATHCLNCKNVLAWTGENGRSLAS